MKKLNLFLLILVLVLGGFILFKQFAPSNNEILDEPPIVDEESSSGVREVGLSVPKPKEQTQISEYELHVHLKNKRYLENTYMALEYSKVNTQKLIETIENYLDDNTKMKPEDMSELIRINEKTFLNRYLKVFVSAPNEDLIELNNEMRRIFYQMKLGFDDLNRYGHAPLHTNGVAVEGEGSAENPPIETSQSNSTINITREEKTDRTPEYNMSDLRSGIDKLKQATSLVDDAIKLLGIEDIKIEQKWLEAGISEGDIAEVMDKTNIANSELSKEASLGEVEEESREDRLEEVNNKE